MQSSVYQTSLNAKPFLKWVGGKGKLFEKFKHLIPKSYNRYFEPFVGGGAVLFHLKPNKATINDLNTELINLYRIVKFAPEKLMQELDGMQSEVKNEEFYYWLRANIPDNKLQQAARTVFLNKTCFNGLYRVNQKGKFNTPFGNTKSYQVGLYKKESILGCSAVLQNTEINNGDYADLLTEIRENDFVYLDPPYILKSKTEKFINYTKELFQIEQHKKLMEFCKEIDRKGAKFLLSNSDTPESREIFGDFNFNIIQAPRFIACKTESRKDVNELVVSN